MFFIVCIAFILTILNIIFHLTHVYSKKGFKSNNIFMFSTFIFTIYTLVFFINIGSFIYDNFIHSYFLIFILYHLTLFLSIYISLIYILSFLKFINSFLLKFNSNFDLIPLEYNFLKISIYKNSKLLKNLLLTSYFLSTLSFIFFIKNYLLLEAKTDTSIDFSLFKDDINLYYSIFFISLLPLFINFNKNK